MDTAFAASITIFISVITSWSLGPESWANSIKLLDLMENAVTVILQVPSTFLMTLEF